MRPVLALLFCLLWAGAAHAQGYQCRTSPNGASTAYCSSEAFVTGHFPSSSTTGHVATFADNTGQLLQDGGTVPVVGAGIDQNTLNAQSSDYPIATTDCGKTIYETGGPSTVTLPAVSGFDGKCSVRVCNGNANAASNHAMRMSGFPSPIFARLYPQQCVGVAIESGTWQAIYVPGRFRAGFAQTLYVDNGGSGSNDGIASNASTNALQTMQQCFSILQNEYDLIGQQPTCSPTGGQTLVGSFSLVGSPVASSVINIIGNGGQATLRPTAGNTFVLEMADFAGYVISKNINFDCTGGGTACFGVFFHQQSGADFNQLTLFTGNGTGHEAFACDSVCKVNVNSDASTGIIIQGTFGNAFSGNFGSMFAFDNGMTLQTGTSISGSLFQMQQNSVIQFTGALNAASGTSVGGDVFTLRSNSTACLSSFTQSWVVQPTRKFSSLNNSLLSNTSSNPIPGTSAGIVTATGFAAGFAPDNLGGNTGVSASGC